MSVFSQCLSVSTVRIHVRTWWVQVKSLSAVLWAATLKGPFSLCTSAAKNTANTCSPEASLLYPDLFNLLSNKLQCCWRTAQQLAAEQSKTLPGRFFLFVDVSVHVETSHSRTWDFRDTQVDVWQIDSALIFKVLSQQTLQWDRNLLTAWLLDQSTNSSHLLEDRLPKTFWFQVMFFDCY